ncbi:MAG: TetR/AcrR family transcriptional regulator [Ruminococcus sp.]|nr:TetR/AcrR family transcriptional regulator [Ruminococcus sp.]
MGKVDQNKQQKENSLLKTAFEFFTTKGFSKTSISDIVGKAGVAKGTFYLYFKDKYDIRNKLVSHKSSQLFNKAIDDLKDKFEGVTFEDKIVMLIDNIINQLNENKSLLTFISKNLSWGVFKSAITTPATEGDVNFLDVYYKMLDEAPYEFREPELMMFMIIELVSSTCYSTILYSEPCGIEKLKPYLFSSIRNMIESHKVK